MSYINFIDLLDTLSTFRTFRSADISSSYSSLKLWISALIEEIIYRIDL